MTARNAHVRRRTRSNVGHVIATTKAGVHPAERLVDMFHLDQWHIHLHDARLPRRPICDKPRIAPGEHIIP